MAWLSAGLYLLLILLIGRILLSGPAMKEAECDVQVVKKEMLEKEEGELV